MESIAALNPLIIIIPIKIIHSKFGISIPVVHSFVVVMLRDEIDDRI